MNAQLAQLLLRLLWAMPCTLIGALLGMAVIGLGGSVRRVGHTFEVALCLSQQQTPCWVRRLGFSAITLGHIIVGQSHEVLAVLRAHEWVHVRQYELLGPLFFVAYPAASLLALLRGQCPYYGNAFEKQAFVKAPAVNSA